MTGTKALLNFIRDIYQSTGPIPLHAPQFNDAEKTSLLACLDSTFVSSVGPFVDQFEQEMAVFCQSSRAVATVNGTAALQAALHLAGVGQGDIVITQALTFVATCNAVHFLGATPAFVDVSPISLGLCPDALQQFLTEQCGKNSAGNTVLRSTGQKIGAVVPKHTFGHPVQLDEIVAICSEWQLPLIEDAAESLGSFYRGQHTGTFGRFGALSFNGNKIITTGGGGMVLCQQIEDGVHCKHVTTTAKVAHPYQFFHDEVAFNFRLPNLNAALGCAQLTKLPSYLANKRALAGLYQSFLQDSDYQFVAEPAYAKSNYWLNAVICADEQQQQQLLKHSNDHGIMTRPVWELMHHLPMYKDCPRGSLSHSEWLTKRLVNLPSSVAPGIQP